MHKITQEGLACVEPPDGRIGGATLYDKYDDKGNVIGTIMKYGSNPNNYLRLRSKTKLK